MQMIETLMLRAFMTSLFFFAFETVAVNEWIVS